MKSYKPRAPSSICLLVGAVFLLCSTNALSQSRTYTLDADFDEGTLINVNHDAPNNDQLQLNAMPEAFEFIWVAASARGTIVKIDTKMGTVLGEYHAAPQGMGLDPSRTTVDANGNVWSGNRAETGLIAGVHHGSVVKIGLLENGQCVDRNGNGTIDTSTGLGDIKAWPNITDGVGDTDGAPHGARVQDAVDECILLFQRVPDADEVRHVSVDASNNVWIGGYPFAQRSFHRLQNTDGAILASFDARRFGCGGYGGLIDVNGILWSASISQGALLRYDPGADTGTCIPVSSSYGLGIDNNGFVWNSMWTNNSIVKISPAGIIQAGFPKPTAGASDDRGVAVTPVDNNVWVANSAGSDVSRLDNNGNLVPGGLIPVGTTPTGVAVDADGKVWVANMGSDNVMRIDPTANAVDLTVSLGAGAGPYNYSDMTGAVQPAAPTAGTWEVVFDSGVPGVEWGFVTWTADEPGDGSIVVTVSSSTDGITFSVTETVAQGVDLTVPDGQYLKISTFFTRASTGVSPILYDLTVVANQPPVCEDAFASPDMIWPPNHGMVDVEILGVTDPDGDDVFITIDGITQDEPLDTWGDGTLEPDGEIDSPRARVRAERMGGKKEPGNGRVYEISFTASDEISGECTGAVTVCVPHSMKGGGSCVDDGQDYNSLGGGMAKSELPGAHSVSAYPNPFNPATRIHFTVSEPGHVLLAVYDIMGRRMGTLVDGLRPVGDHEVGFDASNLPSGTYVVRLVSDNNVETTLIALSR